MAGGGGGDEGAGASPRDRIAAFAVAMGAIAVWIASQLGAGGPLQACKQELGQVTIDKVAVPEVVDVCGPHDISVLAALLAIAALLIWKDFAELSFLGSGVKKSTHALGGLSQAELKRESNAKRAEAAQVSAAVKTSLETLEELLEGVLGPQMDEGQRLRTMSPAERSSEQGVYAEWYSTHRDALLDAGAVLERARDDLESMTPAELDLAVFEAERALADLNARLPPSR